MPHTVGPVPFTVQPEVGKEFFVGVRQPGMSVFLWWLPRLSFMLFVATVLALLWYSERNEREEHRATLISDMLWLEQNMRFLMVHNEEVLGRFRHDDTTGTAMFDALARSLIDNHAGIYQVVWRDAAGMERHVYPPRVSAPQLGTEQMRITAQSRSQLAQARGRPAYAPPYQTASGDWQFEVHVPIFHNSELRGTTVGVYSIHRLLEDAVPWWLTERYHIEILDPTRNLQLGMRSKVGAMNASDNHYTMAFDPPGHGLTLRATPYPVPTSLAHRLISGVLVILAVLVLMSLWALRRHVQQRLAAETALQNEAVFRKAMEDSVQTGLRARNLEGMITYVNPAFCRMVGWTAEELVGCLPPMPYWAEEYIEETRSMNARVLAGQAPIEGFEIKLKRRNGEIFDALIHEAPLIDSQGKHTGWMSSVIDISEHKQATELARQQEERLQASARLVTMGEMASSLAHELNQPLSAISSYLAGSRNLIASHATTCEEIDGALGKCQDQAQRAGRIIRRIYEFVRRHEPKSEACSLEILLADLLLLIEADARRQRVRLVRDIAPDLPVIRADQILLGQAVLNLMKNGIDAMRQTPEAERQLTVSASVQLQKIEIVITDRGSGIAPADAERLFEPFFTTKTEGLGVGLNICRSVVEAHHGRLWFEANPAGGSIFHISLPLPAHD